MENQNALIFESARETGYGLSNEDLYIPVTDYDELKADNWITAPDVLQPEEGFILGKEYIALEEEYVRWEETAPCRFKRDERSRDVFEEESSLPEDGSLQSMDQYFRLKTTTRRPY